MDNEMWTLNKTLDINLEDDVQLNYNYNDGNKDVTLNVLSFRLLLSTKNQDWFKNKNYFKFLTVVHVVYM